MKIRLLLLALLAGVSWFFLVTQKERLIQQSTQFLETLLSRETDVRVRIGHVSGNIFGFIRLSDIRVQDPSLAEQSSELFTAKEVLFRYRLLDYISKSADPKFEVLIKDPVVHWQPGSGLRRPRMPFINWMKGLAATKRRNIEVTLSRMTFSMGDVLSVSEINAVLGRDSFRAEVPLRHVEIAGSDVSSTLKLEGALVSPMLGDEEFSGRIKTEGSVVNWQPVPYEATVEFTYSERGLSVVSNDLMGGIETRVAIDFENDFKLLATLRAKDLPLSRFDAFAKLAGRTTLPGKVDFDIRIDGDVTSPNVDAAVRLYDGWLGGHTFKAMNVHVEGVYPTLMITDSRMMLQDESIMRFADRAIEARDLFHKDIYEKMAAEAQQDAVSWGAWEFRRAKPRDVNDDPEFLMERHLGENARLHLRKTNEEEYLDQSQPSDVEVGFEYRLKSKESLKLALREDERFLGVERKMQF